MSRVATNLPTINYTNGYSPANKAMLTRPLTNGSTLKNVANANFNIRSAAPAPIQKETVHACPLCNHEYKDPRVLPCTHTYCFDCIRDKLIQNSRLTCPKCHHQVSQKKRRRNNQLKKKPSKDKNATLAYYRSHAFDILNIKYHKDFFLFSKRKEFKLTVVFFFAQVHPFEEFELKNLPPNLILSQQWRIGARPFASTAAAIRKPVTYQSNVSIPINQPTINSSEMHQQQQQDKRKGSSTEPAAAAAANVSGIAAVINTFDENENNESSLTQSANVSNLIKVYSEALPKSKTKEHDSIKSTGKHNELVKIFQQASTQNQRRPSPSTYNKQQTKIQDETNVEFNEDNLVQE